VPDLPLFNRQQCETVRAATTLDLGALADEVVEVSERIELSDDQSAHSLFADAVASFERAELVFDAADEPDDFADATAAIGTGRFRFACVRARLDHASIPEAMQPCFFDPRHGPAVRLIVWTPPHGDPRTVPTCAYDAELVEADVQPEPRTFAIDEELIPYWDAPLYFVPWFSGFFESVRGCPAASLLAGLPLGEGFAEAAQDEADDEVISRKEIRDRWLGYGPDSEDEPEP